MATFEELQQLFSDSGLMIKVQSALILEAQALLDLATPTAAQKTWAVDTLYDPRVEVATVLRYVVAVNSNSTKEQIAGATEAQVKAGVAAVVIKLIEVKAGV